MKIVILHADEGYIEIVPVEDLSAQMISEGALEPSEWIAETGRDLDNISWQVFEDDDIPVFWDKESIPFITL